MKTHKIDPEISELFQKLRKETWSSRSLIYSEATLPPLLIARLRMCESPIERMLLLALEFIHPDLMMIQPQVEILWYKGGSKSSPEQFRADFVVGLDWASLIPDWEWTVRGENWTNSRAAWLPFFAIECDGRDYHNSHDAIERDKFRDRVFNTRGMPVMRFTGSEINNRLTDCAKQVVDMFVYMLRARLRPGIWTEELVPYGKKQIVLSRWQD